MNIFHNIFRKDVKRTPLSDNTIKKIQLLFKPVEFSAVEKILVEECGNNLVGLEKLDEIGLERIRFAVLKISDGKINSLVSSVDRAKYDWRDILVDAGFGDDVHAHKDWVPKKL